MSKDNQYRPYTNPEVIRLMNLARATNAERDYIDRENRVGAPGDSGIGEFLRTAMSAISSGLSTSRTAGLAEESWTCVAEGLAMLEDAELRVRQAVAAAAATAAVSHKGAPA